MFEETFDGLSGVEPAHLFDESCAEESVRTERVIEARHIPTPVIPPAALPEVKDVQPYNRQQRPETYLLTLVRELYTGDWRLLEEVTQLLGAAGMAELSKGLGLLSGVCARG